MGLTEVIGKLPAVFRALATLQREVGRRRPDAAVLIDFPDFHSVLSRGLRKRGIPLIYYVPPAVWAWRPGRARVIAERARRILTLFSFETEIYRRFGADAVWTGHPIVEDVHDGLAAGPGPLPAKSRPRLALLPGSRRAEVRRCWPPLREAAAQLARRRGVEAFVVRAPGLTEDLYPGAEEAGVRILTSGIHALLASADLALVASGTATLEAALCGAPMVVVYRASKTNYAIGRRLVRVPWISPVNILAREEVVPELLQDDLTQERLRREAEDLLDSHERRERMRRGYDRVARELGPPGASARAAEAVIETLGGAGRAPARTARR